MPGKIKILPQHLANMIAAGEVVEKPASVVKELIENSIDANACKIKVEIEDGGKRLIKVIDNGCGMIKDDLILSLERHATSKIYEKEDLHRIETLGFRGEALPSIAAVSKIEIVSKVKDEIIGNKLYAEGGKIEKITEIGAPDGTKIEVKELFYNTPARQKFLKSSATEFGHIFEVVKRFALFYFNIHFILLHNGKEILNLPPTPTPLSRISKILEDNFIENSIKVELSTDILNLNGYCLTPHITASSSKKMYIFLNGRFVKDKIINRAVIQGYSYVIPKDRYPIVLLYLEVPYETVDVNVHPTKSEVKFLNENAIYRLISNFIKEKLEKGDFIKEEFQKNSISLDNSYIDRLKHRKIFIKGDPEVSFPLFKEPFQFKENLEKYPSIIEEKDNLVLYKNKPEKKYFSSLIPIGQLKDSFLLCESYDGLVIIDQHAAHERIQFDKLKNSLIKNSKIETQSLLVPVTVNLSPSETPLLEKYKNYMEMFGFEIDFFSGNTFVIKGVPIFLITSDYSQLIKDIIEEFSELNTSENIELHIDKILSKIACHTSVRGGKGLQLEEIKNLLHQLDEIDFGTNCPHGRPIFKTISTREIEKMFGRV